MNNIWDKLIKRLDAKNKKKEAETRHINGGEHLETTKDSECILTESDIGKWHVKSTRQAYGKPAANTAMKSTASNKQIKRCNAMQCIMQLEYDTR